MVHYHNPRPHLEHWAAWLYHSSEPYAVAAWLREHPDFSEWRKRAEGAHNRGRE